jgi:hypothetical protein
MKIFSKSLLVSVAALAVLSSTANAGWMVVNDDGSMAPYTADCCHVVVKKVKRVKKKRVCKTCDYSMFPDAQTLPLNPGEKLPPAKLGFCGKK